MIRFTSTLLVVLSCLSASKGQDLDQLAETYAAKSLNMFGELLAIPNDAHFPADIEKNMQWCEAAFQQRGFTLNRLHTDRLPLLLATRSAPKAKKPC